MIKVKLTTYAAPSVKGDFVDFLSQTPHSSGEWGDFKFYINEEIDHCDYWVVFDYVPEEESTVCQKENVILVAGEPSAIKKYNQKFLDQFSKVITCQRKIMHPTPYYMAPGHPWRSKKSYDELSDNNHEEKSKLISIIVSNKSGTSGHKKRLEFCLALKEHFGDKIDLFGRGIQGFDDKWKVLAPYKYSIAIENSIEIDNMTEKIGDCFTALTFPFYCGCPNISDYYDPDSYQLIDVDDFKGSCDTIEKIINDENHYSQHLNSLIESKNRYINQWSVIPLIAHFIKKEYREETITSDEKIIIKPEPKKEITFLLRIFYKIKEILTYA